MLDKLIIRQGVSRMKVHQNKTNLIKISLRKNLKCPNSSARAIVLNIITYPTDIN